MFCVTAANRHDSVVFEQLVDALPDVKGKCGKPRRWPDKLHADTRAKEPFGGSCDGIER